jgi:cellulose synthase (UDP-forming)
VTRSRLWRELESGDTTPLRALRFVILASGTLFLCYAATLFLSWQAQLLFAGLTLLVGVVLDRSSKSHVVTLMLVLLSAFSTLRYAVWRFSTAINYFRDPGTNWTALDAFFIWMLLAAESYAFVVLLLGYLQTLWPLRRSPTPLPNDPEEWPAIDLLIPTYNEPLSIVRFTALAAMNIDWPPEKLNVYILDDGKREEFRAFAEEAGVGYMARDSNVHAKAGNINYALERVSSPFVALFDCDHVPTRSFLQLTIGWFLRDPRLAMLQTPQHAYSPDPFERNLGQFHLIPNEDELFYGVVQDGNDFWNATAFCGSCAVLRRSALDDVGGVAVETVTEDVHTSLRMQMKGWNTAYINIPQAAGLANERLTGHIRQRIRWARGMVQILRIENPLFAQGLKPAQRLCYFNAMSHFLYALPRLIFLTAPLIYLIFGVRNLPGFWLAIVAYAAPYLLLAAMTNSRIQQKYRHSFWNEIYETVLAPYILLPTLIALVKPATGAFNVTPKGGLVQEDFFDARIARPFLLLIAFNLFGLLCAAARFVPFPTFRVGSWLWFVNWPASIYDPGHLGTILVNVLWAVFNLTILGVATAVAWESQQRRRSVRVVLAIPADVIFSDGSMIQGMTCDLSSGGARTLMNQGVRAKIGDPIKFVFPVLDGSATLPATIVAIEGSDVRAQFNTLTLQEDEALTMILYSRADAWLDLANKRETDHPMRSLARILRLSLRGLRHALIGTRGKDRPSNNPLATSVLPLVLVALAAAFHGSVLHAATIVDPGVKPSTASLARSPIGAGQFDNVLSLSEEGIRTSIILRGVDASRSVSFSVPRNQVVKSATMKLRYHLSPGLLPGISQLNVSLNGTLVKTLAVNTPPDLAGEDSLLEATIPLPAELLVHQNQITFGFIGHYALQCEDPANTTLWARVDPSTTIELAGSLLPVAPDLSLLPFPFYDDGAVGDTVLPIVFLGPPSATAIQAAGVIASWFGVLSGSRPVLFPVSIGKVPAGNAIVIAEQPAQIPSSLNLGAVSGATVAMVNNPGDPYSSLLVVTGGSEDDLLVAARALTVHGDSWQGARESIRDLTLPQPRKPDDAPRWLSTEGGSTQTGLSGDLQSDGSRPESIYFRLPPDLFFSGLQNLPYHLSYRYNGVPLGDGSTLQVYVNGAFVSATPMPHTDRASNVLETVVPIPVFDLRPFSNTITFQFLFQRASQGRCGASVPMNLEGAILKDSHLDISGIPHSTVLPNLELFANAGYPFTRVADLGETAVVLPDRPSSKEIELYLALVGHFGAQTGYPGLRMTVVDASGMTADGKKSYLVLGTAEDQPALKEIGGALPVQVDGGTLKLIGTDGLLERGGWWRKRDSDSLQSGKLKTDGAAPDGLIEEVQWPSRSGRTVVAIILRDSAAVPSFLAAFLAGSQSSEISQSVSILHGSEFSSYRVGDNLYRVGQIGIFTRISNAFQDAPWLIALLTVMFCFLMAALIQAMLRRHARLRLQPTEQG